MQVGQLTAVLTLDKSNFDKGLDDAKSKSESTGGFLGNAFDKARSALGPLTVVAGGLTAALGAAGAAGLSFNNDMEKARARLNAFNKDAKTTNDDLAFINQEASKTPFAFGEMVNSFAALKPVAKSAGMDVKDLLGTAEVLAALNPAQGLEGAAIALRSAVGGDFTSAIERFDIPRELIQKLKDEGVPNAQIVGQALQQMGYDATLVSNMAATAEGRWSTFTDTLRVLAGTVTQPIFDAFSAGLGSANDTISAAMPTIQALADTLANNVKTSIDWIANTAIPALISGWNQIQPVVRPVIDLIANNLQPILIGIGATILAIVVPAIVAAVGAFLSVAAPIAAMIAVGALLYKAWESNFLGIRDIVAQVFATVQTIIATVLPIIQTIITTVVSAITAFWQQNGTAIMDNATTIWNTILSIITIVLDTVWAVISTVLTEVAGFISAHGTEIQTIFSQVWTVIESIVSTAIAIVKGVLLTTLALIKGDWKGAWDAIKEMFNTVWENIKTILKVALDWLIALLEWAWKTVGDNMRKAWDGVLTLFKIILGEIRDTVAEQLNGAINYLTGLAGRWRSAGTALIDNFFEGLKSKAQAIIDFARSIAQKVADILPGSEPKDPTSPLRGLAHRGEALVNNFKEGIERASGGLTGAVTSAATNIANNTINNAAPTFNLTYVTQQSSGSIATDIAGLQALTRGA